MPEHGAPAPRLKRQPPQRAAARGQELPGGDDGAGGQGVRNLPRLWALQGLGSGAPGEGWSKPSGGSSSRPWLSFFSSSFFGIPVFFWESPPKIKNANSDAFPLGVPLKPQKCGRENGHIAFLGGRSAHFGVWASLPCEVLGSLGPREGDSVRFLICQKSTTRGMNPALPVKDTIGDGLSMWWNPAKTLPQGRPGPPWSLSEPQSFLLLGKNAFETKKNANSIFGGRSAHVCVWAFDAKPWVPWAQGRETLCVF